jgi:hypothetical protein
MMRAEFAYQDTTAPDISLGLIQHPVFPDRADVYVAGTEPLHPGSSTGTLTPPGGSPLELLFERTLGLRGLRGAAPAALNTGTVSIAVEAFDRYGGLSDTAAIDVGVARIAEGQGASLFTAGESGAVGLNVPAGEHRGALLTLISYADIPAGMPEAPTLGQAALGSPLVSVGPVTWTGPARGSELRIPIRNPGEGEYHLERWNGSDWQSVPGSVQLSGGFARGNITGGGWYRLAAGAAPDLPAARSGVEVLGNAPNPFNPETRIRFRIPPDLGGANVKLVVLNTRGQEVRTLVDGPLGSGLQEITWDGRNEGGHEVASGIYLYRLEVGNTVISRKMLLLR